jgi:alpha-beta hydrolase superfamily lysophospholipase
MTPSEPTATVDKRQADIEIRGAKGTMLRGRWWRRQSPRGVLVISHGFGEHGGGYVRVAEALSSRLDLNVLAADYRGHGRSPGRRGVVGNYEELTEDLHAVLDWAERQAAGLPQFLLAHSNGGQVALRLALENRRSIAGMVVSNPALRLVLPVPRSKLMMARVLAVWAPWVTLTGNLRTDLLTRDAAIQEEHRADPLRHSRMSAPLFFGMVEGGELLAARAGEIRTPILLVLGGQDPVIDPDASRVFFERLGSEDKTLVVYPNMLHEPFNEIGREHVVDDVARWLEQRL